ncbi:MAG: hypothetical protein N3F66_02865 [Spirochaetes bacterium]|nr:hypothetical protein [Spirochaetota bacterium]
MKQLLFLIVVIFYSTVCTAKVIVTGLTIPIDISDIENGTVVSHEQAKAVAIALTNKLHALGYTTSYVHRYELAGDKCVLHVVQSYIFDIQIIAHADVKESIVDDLNQLKGTIYNKNTVYQYLLQLKEKYMLDSVSVDVVNYNEGDDVKLIVRVRAMTLVYSFEIATLPIYGVTPSLMLSAPLYKAIATAQGQVGFNEERVTVKKVMVDYMHFMGKYGYHAGSDVSAEYAVWERYASDFTLLAIKPYMGCGKFSTMGAFDISAFIYAAVSYLRVSGYDDNPLAPPLHTAYTTTGVELRIRATDSRSITKKNKNVNISLFAGVSSGTYNITSRILMYMPLPLTSRLYIIPTGYSFYTNLRNRVYSEYVFDSYLSGYPRRYTTTHSRHIATVKLMYEVVYEFIFVELFASSGMYKTEYNKWDGTSSYGVSADVVYTTTMINFGCAWNADENFKKYYVFAGVRAQL